MSQSAREASDDPADSEFSFSESDLETFEQLKAELDQLWLCRCGHRC